MENGNLGFVANRKEGLPTALPVRVLRISILFICFVYCLFRSINAGFSSNGLLHLHIFGDTTFLHRKGLRTDTSLVE